LDTVIKTAIEIRKNKYRWSKPVFNGSLLNELIKFEIEMGKMFSAPNLADSPVDDSTKSVYNIIVLYV